MKFISGGINGEYLRNIHYSSKGKTNSIKLAIAYASGDPEILKENFDNGVKISFWGRYDSSVPVSTQILKHFLEKKSLNFQCKLVPDLLHSKIIWWEEFGAYVGSANLTDRAWFNNIEAGVFLEQKELVENDMIDELENFFSQLDKYATPLSQEIYDELLRFESKNKAIDNHIAERDKFFDKKRLIPEVKPLTYVPSKKDKSQRSKNNFTKEWYSTLEILRTISEKVSHKDYRPSWIGQNVPKGVQADQFLHAFYYSQVKQGNAALHHEFFLKNRSNPDEALYHAMAWWKSLSEAPHSEDVIINEWSVFLGKQLSEEQLLSTTKETFIEICHKVHALRDYSLRVKYASLGFKTPNLHMNHYERINLLANHLYNSKSKNNSSIIECIYYLLYGGPKNKTPDRIWEVAKGDEWSVRHFGISSAGEIVGWAMPDTFPPRNGRTSKALTALGFNVKIHSE